MSFSSEIKTEILKSLDNKKLDFNYFICGLIYSNKPFLKSGILCHFKDKNLTDFFYKIIKSGKINNLYIKNNQITYSGLSIKDFYDNYFSLIKNVEIKNKNSISNIKIISFISGAFLFCANAQDPLKSYHIDFLFDDKNDCIILRRLLLFYNINSKYSFRNNKHTIYIKESENIEDLLTLIGASSVSISLMNIKIFKDMRNKVNRITNCETANLDKMVNASTRQVEDIKFLKKIGVFKNLDDKLKEVSNLRINNPDLSLCELANLKGNITKSGLTHRFKKINEIANNYRKVKN